MNCAALAYHIWQETHRDDPQLNWTDAEELIKEWGERITMASIGFVRLGQEYKVGDHVDLSNMTGGYVYNRLIDSIEYEGDPSIFMILHEPDDDWDIEDTRHNAKDGIVIYKCDISNMSGKFEYWLGYIEIDKGHVTNVCDLEHRHYYDDP
jgi:hypothetical protein